MRVRRFQAPDMAQAMAQVRSELGPEAFILSAQAAGDGVELTAAEEQDAAPLPRALGMAEALHFHGVPPAIAEQLEGEDLAEALGRLLRFAPLPVEDDGPPLLLAGVPGCGKTLSVARLATRMVLAGITPMIVTADARRAGAAEELAAFTRLLGLELVAASTPGALARALAAREPFMPVLIDTPGIDPFADDDLRLIAALAESAGARIAMVSAAGSDATEAGEQAEALARIGARHLLPTRLDIARRLGSVLSAAASGALVLGEAGTGPGAVGGLEALTADSLARRLLHPRPAALPFVALGKIPPEDALREDARAEEGPRPEEYPDPPDPPPA